MVCVHIVRHIYRSRLLQCIGVIAVALLLIACATAFVHQGGPAHAQQPGQQAVSPVHSSSTRGCSSVDGVNSGNINAALAQCGEAGTDFKASVIAWGAKSTVIKAGLQGRGMPYMNRCSNFACSTPEFPANAGDTICYQASADNVETGKCYKIPTDSTSSTISTFWFHQTRLGK